MKKSLTACLLLIVLVTAFGCKKDDNGTTTPGFSVKIDGTAWTSGYNLSYYSSALNITVITNTNATSQEQIQVGFVGNDVGTYNFSADVPEIFGIFSILTSSGDGYASYFTENPVGQIVISEVDKTNHTITGTFHFEGYNIDGLKKTFTEGKFTKLTYTVQ
jgi:hypothetical protein